MAYTNPRARFGYVSLCTFALWLSALTGAAQSVATQNFELTNSGNYSFTSVQGVIFDNVGGTGNAAYGVRNSGDSGTQTTTIDFIPVRLSPGANSLTFKTAVVRSDTQGNTGGLDATGSIAVN